MLIENSKQRSSYDKVWCTLFPFPSMYVCTYTKLEEITSEYQFSVGNGFTGKHFIYYFLLFSLKNICYIIRNKNLF